MKFIEWNCRPPNLTQTRQAKCVCVCVVERRWAACLSSTIRAHQHISSKEPTRRKTLYFCQQHLNATFLQDGWPAAKDAHAKWNAKTLTQFNMAHWGSLFCLLACVVKGCRISASWFLTCQHGCQQSGTRSMLQLDRRRWIIEWNIYSELLKGSRACKTLSKFHSDTNKKAKFLCSLEHFCWAMLSAPNITVFNGLVGAKPHTKMPRERVMTVIESAIGHTDTQPLCFYYFSHTEKFLQQISSCCTMKSSVGVPATRCYSNNE